MSLEFINWFEGIPWSVVGVYATFWAIVWGSIGALVGDAYKRQAAAGFLCCALLGPLGFLLLISAEDRREEEFWKRWEREAARIEQRLIRNVENRLSTHADRIVDELNDTVAGGS